MADIHELDPGVEKLKRVIQRRSTCARYLFASIDGISRNGDIAEQLREDGVYANANTSVVSLSVLVRDINKTAVDQWGQPLIVKQGAIAAYSCPAELAHQFVELRYALLPMDMGSLDPTAFMDDHQKEIYRQQDERYLGFASILDGISSSLDLPAFHEELIVNEGNQSIFFPKKDLVGLYQLCAGIDSDKFKGILPKEQVEQLALTGAKAQKLNELTYALVGQEIIHIRGSGVQGRVRFEYQVNHEVLDNICKIGIEIGKLPHFEFTPDDVEGIEESISFVNGFLNGKIRELGFINTRSIRDTLLLREMLEKLDVDNRIVMEKRSQLLIIMNHRLASWSIVRKKDTAIRHLVAGIVASNRPRDGKCAGLDPELFFPERGESTREAKEVCRGCKSRGECLEFALQNGEKFGVWGGLSERERRRHRKKRREEAKKTKELNDQESHAMDEDSEELSYVSAGE
jgi:WhiB family redox-sensing transcriptional regulator